MGGKSSSQKEQIASNQAMVSENVQRSYDYERQAAEDERGMRNMQYMMNLESNQQAAGFEAAQRVTEERADAIRMSGNLLTDFERQEKRRLMEAKKGVGQVSDEDFMISSKDRENALSLLEKPEEYWEAKRNEAFEKASKGAGSSYGGHQAFLESGAASKKWAATQKKTQESGAAYNRGGGADSATRTKRERDYSLLGNVGNGLGY